MLKLMKMEVIENRFDDDEREMIGISLYQYYKNKEKKEKENDK